MKEKENQSSIRNISFSPPDISDEEINSVVETLKSGWITTGPKTKIFEEKIALYCGADKAVCLNSATAGLELTLRLLGIGEGDEVITSAYTYTASASVIYHVGATPVLVDVKESYGMPIEMDYAALEKAITPKTKAIIPVDIAGIVCDYDKILEIVKKQKNFVGKNELANQISRIALIADGAHSFGSTRNGKNIYADFTCFSFHAVKNLTTGEGGAVAFCKTDSKNVEDIYKQYMLMSLHGQSKDALAKTKLGAWEYDIITPAYKCNMTDIMASIGLVQLQRYDELIKRRHQIVKRYNEAFKDTFIKPLNHFGDDYISNCHLYITRLEGKDIEYRNNFINELAKSGIASNVHYKPLPLLTAYNEFNIKNYPNAYNMYANEVTLPLHTLLTDGDVEYIIDTILQIVDVSKAII